MINDKDLPVLADKLLPWLSRKQFATGTVNTKAATTTTVTSTVGASASALAALQAQFNTHQALDFVAAHITSDPTINVHKEFYSDDFGVIGDGTTDDTNAMQRMFDTIGAAGGGRVIVNSLTPAGSIYISKTVTIYYSNMDVVFRSPLIYGATSSLRIMGNYDEVKPIPGTPNTSGKLTTNSTVNGSSQTVLTLVTGQGAYFSVGDKIVVRGLNDVNGNAIQKDTSFIYSIAGDVITCTDELDYTFQPNYTMGSSPISSSDWPPDATTGTTINKVIYATSHAVGGVNVDIPAGSWSVTVNSLSGFSIGDLVQVGDSRTEWDYNNSALKGSGAHYANPAALEFARIIGFNLNEAPATGETLTIYLDRPTTRAYLASFHAGIARIIPVTNSHISGARISYNAHQTSTSYNALQMTYAAECSIHHCIVNGYTYVDGTIDATTKNFINDYGRCGHGLRISYAYNCVAYNNIIRDCAMFNSGQGYGFTLYYCTGCYIFNCVASGCRHNYLHQLATQCGISGCESRNHLISGFDYHGVNSDGCWLDNCIITQGNGSTGDSTIAAGVRVGNTSHSNGDHRITISNCKFFYNAGTSDIAFDFIAASSNVTFRNLEVYNANIGVKFTLNSSQVTPVQTASNIKIIDCEFVNCTGDRPFKFQATPVQTGGVSTGKIDGLFISNVIDDGNNRHLEIVGTGANGINNVHIDNYMVINNVNTAGRFGVLISDVVGVSMRSCDVTGCNKGLSLTNCTGPARIIDNALIGLLDGTPAQYYYVDGGGNTSAVFLGNYTDTGIQPSGTSQWTTTGSDIYYTTGKVGIGVAAPLTLLHVKGAVVVPTNHYGQVIIEPAGTDDVFVSMRTTRTATPRTWLLGAGNSAGAGDTNFRIVDLTAGANRLSVDSGGFVGIGTTTPQALLSVSNGGAEGVEIVPVQGGEAFVLAYNRNTSAYFPLHIRGSQLIFDSGSSALERMRIDASGNMTLTGTINTGGAVKNTWVTGALTASQTMTANIDVSGNATPAITDGTQIVSVSYTPTAASKVIRIRAAVPYLSSNASTIFSCTLWAGSACIAQVANQIGSGATSGQSITMEGVFTSASTSALTIQLRIGPNVNTTTLTLNPKFGNAANSHCQPYLDIDEYV